MAVKVTIERTYGDISVDPEQVDIKITATARSTPAAVIEAMRVDQSPAGHIDDGGPADLWIITERLLAAVVKSTPGYLNAWRESVSESDPEWMQAKSKVDRIHFAARAIGSPILDRELRTAIEQIEEDESL